MSDKSVPFTLASTPLSSIRQQLQFRPLFGLRPFFAILLAWLLLISSSQAVNGMEILGAGSADVSTTMVVNDSGDNADSNTGDGVCDVDLVTPGLQCTLRAAIQEANATAGVDTITFNIAGAGVKTIAPLTILPTISNAVILDGTTQPGFAGTPLIELSGASCATNPCHGLWIAAGGSTVKGLIVNRFANRGIFLDTGDGNMITGNIIGADSSGTAAAGNNTGIFVTDSANNTIGGTASDLRNIISGNNIDGINLNGAGTTGNTILGNYIGVDVNGTADLGNLFSGVVILNGASNNTVGGADASRRNIISGNQQYGVGLNGTAANVTGNVIAGNTIGPDVTGGVDLGNTLDGVIILNASGNVVGASTTGVGTDNIISGNDQNGVLITGTLATGNQLLGNHIGVGVYGFEDLGNGLNGVSITGGASNNVIGGVAGGARNAIGFNVGGVVIDSGIGNAVRGNDIYAHSQIGLDLVDPDHPDVTPNDPGDGDDGPNHLQNFPVLTAATGDLGSLTTVITGTLNSQPNTLYNLDFFDNPDCSPTGYGEGEAYLGSTAVTTDGSGNASFTIILPAPTLAGEYVTATATDPDGNTSEFSACTLVSEPEVYLVINTDNSGPGSLRQAILDANSHPGLDLIHFNIPGSGVHTIRPTSGLFALTGPVIIDGYTQPGASPNTLAVGNNAILTIELDGSLAGFADGLQIVGGNSTVRGLVVNRFEASGLSLRSVGGNRIVGNFIGTDASGAAALGNIGGGLDVQIGDSTIGSTAPADRNLISGNGNDTTFNSGIGLQPNASDNVIQGNYLGTDRAGLYALRNRGAGLAVRSSRNLIGGTAPGAGNLLSGNGQKGIGVSVFDDAHENVIQGNFIGVNAAGTAAIGNGNVGLEIGGNDNLIGGTTPAARNLISGNAPGVGLSIFGSRNVVQGNYIGTDASGALALGNGRAINVTGLSNADVAEDNLIGGAAPGAGNLISGNTGDGIYLSSNKLDRTVIQGNTIGLDAGGASGLGNGGSGIFLWTSGSGTGQTIGGLGAGEGNRIAYNAAGGVTTESSVAQITISGNAIFANGGLGIDLGDRPGGDGVTPNDPGDLDDGANGLLNFPVLTGVQFDAGATTITGMLNSLAAATYHLEFFDNPSCSGSGFGEGQTFIGTTDVTTDGFGNAGFSVTFPTAVPANHVITASATDAQGNTSEFSRCAPQIHQPATYTVTTTADSGPGSLRQAIQDANFNNALDTIAFDIPGPGPHTITPLSPLPYLVDPVVLDAATQPGTACPLPAIELDGSQAGGFADFENPVTGLVIAGGNSTVRGFIINRFSGQGLRLQSNGGNVVECNYIGVDSTGTLDLGNLGLGISTGGIELTDVPNNRIGGVDPTARNLISGNGAEPHPVSGIYVDGIRATGNVIAGNYIGVNANGAAAIPNTGWGVRLNYGASANLIGGTSGAGFSGPCAGACNLLSGNPDGGLSFDRAANDNQVLGNFIGTDVTGMAALPNGWGITVAESSNNTIGGTVAGAGNLVSGNTYYGITIGTLSLVYSTETTRDNVVQGNRIGTDRTGVVALGNGRDGVLIDRVSHNQIGGAVAGAANIIAFNGWSGVAVTYRPGPIEGGVGNFVVANAIANNATLGLDLGNDGVSSNDSGDGDSGPNNLQNYPVVTAATSSSGAITLVGSLASSPSAPFVLDFYSSPTCDPSGYGEGATYLGAITVQTDPSGAVSFNQALPAAVPVGHFVTASATAADHSTSEFSACVIVTPPAEACTPGPHSGTIASNETWCAGDSPHTLTGDVIVAPGVTLTIEPGVVVKGNSNVELKVQGHLAAVGTAAQPITFTSSTDTAANQWSGLIFDGGTGDLNYATVRYGGNINSINGNCSTSGLGFNIAVRNVLAGEVRLQNSQVLSQHYLCNGWQNADYGLYVDNSHVTIDNTLFQSNGNASDDYPLYAFGADSVVALTNSVFTANARQRVLFGASVLSTWDASLAPQTGLEGYELAGDMVVPTGHTWTVQPGAVLMGRDDVEIKVQGHLDAIGTQALPITFTSSTNTGIGQWSGLVFDGGTGDLRYATVRYGGDPNSINSSCSTAGLGFNVAVRNVLAGEVRLENSQVLSERFNCNNWQAEDYGLYVVNSHVVVSDTLFQANGNDGSDYPIYVQNASSTLALTGNTFTGNPRNRVLLGSGALTAANVHLEDEQGLESYELEADYVVPLGITLTVDPGVTVMGRSNVELRTLGHLAAIGTPNQPITFTSATNTGPDQWSGLVFDSGTGDLDYATVRYGGNVNSINGSCSTSGLGFNVAVRNVLAGEVRLENSQILSERFHCNNWQTEDYGLYVLNSHVVVSDTLFQANGNDGSDYPIYVQSASSTLALTGNTFTGNPRNRVLLAAGALTAINVGLEAEQGLESYELEADYVVPVGITLTVDPGVTVMGRGNVELRTLGHLAAIGTPSQPITFTSATNTAANQWSGLVFDGGTGDVQHATVRYGGNVNSINASCSTSGMGFNIAVRNVLAGEVRLQNSQVLSERFLCNGWQTEDYGLYVDNSHVVASDTLFQANGNDGNDYPIYVQGANSTLALTGNTFTGNPRNRVLVIPGAMTAADFTLVAETGLESYELPADFTVPAGITMTLEPGIMVMGRGNVELRTLGHLAAIGTPSQPITFTSATNTAANQWSGLVFDGGTGDLRYATVRYGGNVNSINANCSTSGMGFNVGVRNVLAGEVRLQNSQVLSERYLCNGWTASDYGLYVTNSRVTINNTLFASNGNSSNDYAVYATGASSVLTFDGNVVRNNVRGAQLNGVASQTLRNTVVIDNQLGGISIGSGTNAQMLHTTVARNGGDGVTVASGGSISLVNTILAENVTGVRVTAGGAATLSQTLWDDNGTNTVGAVNQTGSLAGLATFDNDGYHLTRYSTAIEQGMDAGVLTDVDGQARPQPAGTLPDLGADEYIYGFGEELIFEKIALPPQWTVAPPPQGGIPSGSLTQRYLLRYYYGSSDPNPPALTVALTDTLPAALTLENEEHYPAMSFQQGGQTLSWQTLQPVARGQAGQIELDTRYDNPQPGDVLTNTAALHAGSVYLTDLAVTQVPIFAPLIVAPGNGEMCAGQVEIRGLAQPGLTVRLMINNAPVLQVPADPSGQFSTIYTYAGTAPATLTAQACTAGGQCSPASPAVTLTPQQSFWCPQRSSWEGTPTVGPQAGHHLVFNFRNNTGIFSTQNWRIPGVYGFWNTTLHLHGCNCPPASGTTAAPSSVWLIADGVRYNSTGAYPDFTFAVTGGAHTVEFWAQCGANQISSSGRILIDPDGYVFDVTQGFDPISPTLHAMTGVTVTAYVSSTELGGWVPWPAHLYNNQQNPQVTGTDGYFAFFTPPGYYYLQVDGKPGYQPWRSPVVQVLDEIVHVNVPYTPWTETSLGELLPTEVLLTANGPQPAAITVAPGSTVQWRAEVDGLAPPAELVEQTENPALRPLSALNPISNTLGWDGGMLIPGETYRRQMDAPGLYTYTDGLGHQGEICVTPCSALAVTLASFDANAQTDHIMVSWETVSEIGNAGFNLYRSTDGDWGSAMLLTYVPSQAPGSAQGASYTYDDFGVTVGQTAWYWLEAVDLNGATTLQGPVSATLQTPTAVRLSQFEASVPSGRAATPIVLAVLMVLAVIGITW